MDFLRSHSYIDFWNTEKVWKNGVSSKISFRATASLTVIWQGGGGGWLSTIPRSSAAFSDAACWDGCRRSGSSHCDSLFIANIVKKSSAVHQKDVEPLVSAVVIHAHHRSFLSERSDHCRLRLSMIYTETEVCIEMVGFRNAHVSQTSSINDKAFVY